MREIALLVIAGLLISFTALWAHEGEHKEGKAPEEMVQEQGASQEAKEKVVYACPMHPDVRQDKPGECPICGMPLEAQSAESEAPQGIDATEEAAGHHHEEGEEYHHTLAGEHHHKHT